jgi:hypothetical protein
MAACAAGRACACCYGASRNGARVRPGAAIPAPSTSARRALARAVAAGHVVIISGEYGIVRGDELIGWYDKVLQLTDWPVGLLESVLLEEAWRCGAHTVVAFAAATTDYAKSLRRTR